MSFLDKFLLGVWNVGVIEKPVRQLLAGEGYCIRWMKHSYCDRFFADPFLQDVDRENYFILAEEFPFYSCVGRIVRLKVSRKNMCLLNREVVIEEPYHLSYPFVRDGGIVPEAYRSNGCFGYNRGGGDRKLIMAHGLIDQTFLSHGGREWIFATDADDPLGGLKVFCRDIDGGNWCEHCKSPVKSDIRTARPGGHFFVEDGVLYRPAQDSEKLYGHKIHVMRVDLLTENDFQETEVAIFSAAGSPPYDMGFHTFNAEDGFIVVDGYREYRSFFIKPLCLKMRRLMTWAGEMRK